MIYQEMKLIINKHMVLRTSLTKCYQTPNSIYQRKKYSSFQTGDIIAPSTAVLSVPSHQQDTLKNIYIYL